MPRSVFFAYTIEAEEGRVTISISGSMAAQMLERMARPGRRQWGARHAPFPSPFDWLGSAAVSLAPLLQGKTAEGDDDEAQGEGIAAEDLASIFGQGFDSGYDEFSQRLLAYRSMIEGPQEPASRGAAVGASAGDANAPARAESSARPASRQRRASTRSGRG